MTITINDRRRKPAAGYSLTGDAAMAESENVMVQPLTTYLDGAEQKSASSEPYPMPRWQAIELEALGHGRIVGDAPEADAAPGGEAAPAEEPAPALEPEPAPEPEPEPAPAEEPAPEPVAEISEPAPKPTRGRGRSRRTA